MRGAGLAERIEVCSAGIIEFQKMLKDDEFDEEAMDKNYGVLCDDIGRERERIGGDWAVAMSVNTRRWRDFVRSRLGPDLTFVVLDMAWEDLVERWRSRHGADETAHFRASFFYLFFILILIFTQNQMMHGPIWTTYILTIPITPSKYTLNTLTTPYNLTT